jgi:hypothetical protein
LFTGHRAAKKSTDEVKLEAFVRQHIKVLQQIFKESMWIRKYTQT